MANCSRMVLKSQGALGSKADHWCSALSKYTRTSRYQGSDSKCNGLKGIESDHESALFTAAININREVSALRQTSYSVLLHRKTPARTSGSLVSFAVT